MKHIKEKKKIGIHIEGEKMINIQSDSRKVKPGDTFIAIQCEVNDGHKYIESAIQAGATKIIAERGEYSVPTEIVPNSRVYLENYLKENYNQYLEHMNLIAITGTNGKTTTAFLLYQALNKMGVKTGYIGTIGFYLEEKECSLPNTSVDICDTYDLLIRAYDRGYKTIIMEVSSHALANGRMKNISFDYAIFTNLTQDHLDYHKTMGNYALAKQLLFKKLKSTGKAIINTDDKYHEYFWLKENHNISYGFENAEYSILEYQMSANGSSFIVAHQNNHYEIKTSLLGRYNVYNLLASITTLIELGHKKEEIEKVIPELVAPAGRMDIVRYKTNNIIIDYAHTPDAIEKVVTTVKEVVKGKTYIVFGCTGDRDRIKRPIMTALVNRLSDYFIITNDDPHYEDPKQIVDDMTKELISNKYEICLDRETAIIKGIELLNENDALFILGKGHEEFMIVGREHIPFNDKKIVLHYLEEKEN